MTNTKAGKTKRPEVCPICQKTFRYKLNLTQHMTVHTGEKKHVCTICKKRFQQKWNLRTHVDRVHSKIHPFKCTECAQTFGYSTHFKKHVKKHLLDKVQLSDAIKNAILKPHECTLCRAHFDSKAKLESHMHTHTNPLLFMCEKCGRSFKNKYSIAEHIKNTHDENKDGYMCDQCGVVFYNKRAIAQHFKKGHSEETVVRTKSKPDDNDEKSVSCEVCWKRVSKCYMKNHLNIHYKSRIYPCRYCGKKFLEYGNRRNHERIHTGEKPYVCEVCGKRHAQLGNLLAHRRRTHKLFTKVPNLPKTVRKKKQPKMYVKNPDVPTSTELNVNGISAEIDYVTEFEKMKGVVAEEVEVKVESKDSLDQFLKLTNDWVEKQFEASKTKPRRAKEDKTSALSSTCKEEFKSEDEIPLSHFLPSNSNLEDSPADLVIEDVQEIYEDNDDEDKEIENDLEAKIDFTFPSELDTGYKSVVKDENDTEYIASIMKDVKEFKRKMNTLIFEKIIEELQCHTDTSRLEAVEAIKREATLKKKNPLSLLIKKMDIPDNKVIEKKDGRTEWRCWYCESKFKNRYMLNRHLMIHQPNKTNPFRCNVCNKICKQLDNLKEHLLLHSNKNKFYCEVCGSGFRSRTNFKLHLRSHGEQYDTVKPKVRSKNMKCSFCSKMFYSRFHLIEHERTHTKISPYLCKECGKQYRTKCTFTRHVRSHSNIKDYHCAVCYREFSSKYLVDRHMVTHSGEKKFKCSCGKSFTQKSSMKKHEKYCVNNPVQSPKPHSCTICSKSFFVKHDLLRHVSTHDPTKRYQCEICYMLLKTETNLKRHVERHMKGDKNIYNMNITQTNVDNLTSNIILHKKDLT